MNDISYCSGCLRAKVEKAEGNKKLIDLTETQNASDLQVCCDILQFIRVEYLTNH